MNTFIVIICLLIFIILMLLSSIGKIIFNKNKKNIEIINNLTNIIDFYEKLSLILKISKADFIAFFKYDYSKRYITTNFIFSIDTNDKIIRYTENGILPVTINNFSLLVLNSDDSDLHEVYKSELKDNPISMRGIYKNSFKMYWQNIFKEKINPIGYIVLSYDKEYKISKKDRNKITKKVKKISNFI